MTEDASQPAMDPGKSDRFWRVWRWVIAVAVVVMLVFALRIANSRAPAAGALQRSFQQYQAGRFQEAIVSANAAIAANPASADAYNNLAVSYLGLRQFDGAIQAAQDAIRLKPDYQLAKNNLAWIQREKAKATSAPVQATPSSPASTLLSQSLQHSRAGRFRECIDTATQSAKLNPSSSPAFNNIGFCAGNLQLWDEGIRNLQEAIRLEPNSQLAKNNLAWIQQQRLKAGGAKGP